MRAKVGRPKTSRKRLSKLLPCPKNKRNALWEGFDGPKSTVDALCPPSEPPQCTAIRLSSAREAPVYIINRLSKNFFLLFMDRTVCLWCYSYCLCYKQRAYAVFIAVYGKNHCCKMIWSLFLNRNNVDHFYGSFLDQKRGSKIILNRVRSISTSENRISIWFQTEQYAYSFWSYCLWSKQWYNVFG